MRGGVDKLVIVAGRVVNWWPNHIEAPPSAAFDEHAVEEAVTEGEELTLV